MENAELSGEGNGGNLKLPFKGVRRRLCSVNHGGVGKIGVLQQQKNTGTKKIANKVAVNIHAHNLLRFCTLLPAPRLTNDVPENKASRVIRIGHGLRGITA